LLACSVYARGKPYQLASPRVGPGILICMAQGLTDIQSYCHHISQHLTFCEKRLAHAHLNQLNACCGCLVHEDGTLHFFTSAFSTPCLTCITNVDYCCILRTRCCRIFARSRNITYALWTHAEQPQEPTYSRAMPAVSPLPPTDRSTLRACQHPSQRAIPDGVHASAPNSLCDTAGSAAERIFSARGRPCERLRDLEGSRVWFRCGGLPNRGFDRHSSAGRAPQGRVHCQTLCRCRSTAA